MEVVAVEIIRDANLRDTRHNNNTLEAVSQQSSTPSGSTRAKATAQGQQYLFFMLPHQAKRMMKRKELLGQITS
jgi:hypothetical protein